MKGLVMSSTTTMAALLLLLQKLLNHGVVEAAGVPIVSMLPVSTQTSFPSPMCTEGASQTESFTVNYNFETVERGDPAVATTEIFEYNLLNFLNINYVDTDPDLDGNHLGLAPHTYPAVATFTELTQIGDELNFGQDADKAAIITANYSQSTLTSFTPRSFWYGCVYPFPYTAGSLPNSCNITAAGYNYAGQQVAQQQFAFKANGSVVQDQLYGTFTSDFAQVYSIAFSVTNSDLSAVLIDNFIATLYQPGCAPYYTGSYNNGTYPY